MAVETKFVVVRKGEEKMTFANKKEADAYDKMLDMADAFTDWLLQSELEIDESLAENIALRLAEQKDTVQYILRTSKLPEEEAMKAPVAQAEDPAVTETEESLEETTEETAAAPAPKKSGAVKAA
ncbi:YebG family protein [Ewingella allii]|uniref:YebG family protein n=1 Tax=Ewingella allii TaxID=3092550 RepID=UPI0037B1B339